MLALPYQPAGAPGFILGVLFYQAMGKASEEQKELIEVARLVGLFLDNGFEWNDAGIKVPASGGDMDFRFLEAVTLKLWAQAGRQYWQLAWSNYRRGS